MLGVLVPVGGGDDIFLRKQELVLGRSENCDIVLRYSNISGRHCRLVLSQGYWYVVDLSSTNGVRVDSVRVYDKRIDPGARVSFAGHEYRIQYDPLANGALGIIPPDMLENDILSKSLLERAGLTKHKGDFRKNDSRKGPKTGQVHTRIDYDSLKWDDIEFL